MFPIRDHNPSERTPYVTYTLIALNLLMFALTRGWSDQFNEIWARLALYPAAITQGDMIWGLFTHMFLHAGIMHIGGNMLFLWIFGDNLEDQMGHLGFLLFYLACGLAAAFAEIIPNPGSAIPMVGASGAIAGVMGGYLLLFPRAKVDILAIIIIIIKIFTVPAWVMLGIWFGFQLFGGFSTLGAGDGVAYWAHTGGFVAGIVLVLPLFLRRGGKQFWQITHGHPPHPAVQYKPTRIPKVRR